jgi:MFS family permease
LAICCLIEEFSFSAVTFPERFGHTVDVVGQAQPALGHAPMPTKVTGRRFPLAGPAAVVVLAALALVDLAASVPLSSLSHQLTFSGTFGGLAITACFGGVGVVVAHRQPRNPLGWLLIGFVLLAGLSVDAGFYDVLRYRLGHSGLPFAPVAVLLSPLWAAAFALLPPVILLFPDGRLTSGRWRWVLGIYAGLIACVLTVVCAPAVAAVLGHDIRVDSSGDVRSARDLPGWLAHPPSWLAAVVLVLIVAIALSFVARQAFSWRRATGEHRQQLKWLAFGAAITIGLGLVSAFFNISGTVSYVLSATILALPVSMGIGILKYRLYDIDRIISRTLSYAIVTGLLVGLYAGLVLLATEVFQFHSTVAVAASTLAAAVLFNPVRQRVQAMVDRRFNRARYDADQTVAAFAARLKDAVDQGAVCDDLAGVVYQTLEPAHLSVWISQRD